MFLIVLWRPDVLIFLQGLDGICTHLDRIFSSGMLFSASLLLCMVTILASIKTKRFETQVSGESLTCGDDWSQNTFALFRNNIPQVFNLSSYILPQPTNICSVCVVIICWHDLLCVYPGFCFGGDAPSSCCPILGGVSEGAFVPVHNFSSCASMVNMYL